MSDELELGVKLVDDASKPAARAANGIERIADSVRKTNAELEKLNRISAGAKQFRALDGAAVRAAADLKKQRAFVLADQKRASADAEQMAKNRLRSESYASQKRFRDEATARRKAHMDTVDAGKFDLGKSVGGGIEGLTKNLGMAAAGAAALGAALATKVTYELVQGTVAAMRFRNEALTGLGLITGSAEKANKTFEDSIRLSDRLGTDWQETSGGMQKLLAKGFDATGAEELVKATADLKTVSPDANISNLILAIGQIKTAGKLQGDELNQLSEAGLNSELMFQQLEKRLGKTRAEILKMKEAGQLMAEPVIESIKASVAAMTGKDLGKAAEDASKTMAGMMRRFEQLPNRFFLDVARKADETGFTKTLESLWESVGPGTSGFDSAVEGAVRVFDLVVQGAQTALPIIKEFAGQFVDGFAKIQGIEKGEDVFAQWKDPAFIASVGELGANLGKIAGGIVQIGEAFVRYEGYFTQFTGVFTDGFANIVPGGQAFSAGTAMIDGLTAGLESRREGANGLMGSIATGMLGTFKSALGIASPSKEMAKIGRWTGEGFTVGLADSMPNVFSAANDATMTPGASSVRTAASSLPTISRGAAVTDNSSSSRMGDVNIEINVSGGSGANASDIAREVRREIERTFDGFAIQGAA